MTREEAQARYNADLFAKDLQIDNALREGIENGMNFEQFSAQTRCPKSLQGRYKELEQQAAAAEARKHDAFLEGFMGDNGSYIPREPKHR